MADPAPVLPGLDSGGAAATPPAAVPSTPSVAPTAGPVASTSSTTETPPVAAALAPAAPAAFSAPAAGDPPAEPAAPEPAPVETPAAEPPAPDTTDPAPAPVEAKPSILADAGKKPAEASAAEVKQTAIAEALAPITYDALALPDGVTLDATKLSAFDAALSTFEGTTKADHAAVQTLRQQMVEMYVAEQRSFVEATYQRQNQVWEDTNNAWRETFEQDPDIGRNRKNTTIQRCGEVLTAYGRAVGAEREQALRAAFAVTGAGNHPEFIRFVNHFARFTSEQSKPVAAVVPKAPGRTGSARAQRYNASSTGAA